MDNVIYSYPGMHIFEGMVLPDVFPAQTIRDLRDFSFRSGDVVVDSYPKSGNSRVTLMKFQYF